MSKRNAQLKQLAGQMKALASDMNATLDGVGRKQVVTPTTTAALEGAIRMLRYMAGGRQYSVAEFEEEVRRYEAALNDARISELQDERRRKQIRELGDQARARRTP